MIDVVRPIDYEQLYAQAMALLRSNERYWFDEKEEAIMTEANREFEQSPAIEQLFQVYYRAAEEEEEGEWLLAADMGSIIMWCLLSKDDDEIMYSRWLLLFYNNYLCVIT